MRRSNSDQRRHDASNHYITCADTIQPTIAPIHVYLKRLPPLPRVTTMPGPSCALGKPKCFISPKLLALYGFSPASYLLHPAYNMQQKEAPGGLHALQWSSFYFLVNWQPPFSFPSSTCSLLGPSRESDRWFQLKVSATLKIVIFPYLRFQRFQIDMLESFLSKKKSEENIISVERYRW